MLFFSDVSQISVRNMMSGLVSVKCSIKAGSLLFMEQTFHSAHRKAFTLMDCDSSVSCLNDLFFGLFHELFKFQQRGAFVIEGAVGGVFKAISFTIYTSPLL